MSDEKPNDWNRPDDADGDLDLAEHPAPAAPADDPKSDVPEFMMQRGGTSSSSDEGGWDPDPITSPEPENVPMAFGAGAVAAVLGGVAWALVVTLAGIESGMIAWGIGLIVGLAVKAVAKHGDMNLGVGAAGLAFVGLVVGKVLIAQFGLGYAVTNEIMDDPKWFSDAVYTQMAQDGEVDPEVMAFYKTADEERQPSPALVEKIRAVDAEIASRTDSMTESQKKEVASSYAKLTLEEVPLSEKLQISPWDFLWFGLALYTAFRVCAAQRQEDFA